MPLTEQQIAEFESFLGQSSPLNPNDPVEQFSYENNVPVTAPRNTPQDLLFNESSFDMGTPSEQMVGHKRLGSESELMDTIGFGGGVGDIKELVRGSLGALGNLTVGALGNLSSQFSERFEESAAKFPTDLDSLIDWYASGDFMSFRQLPSRPSMSFSPLAKILGVEDDVVRITQRLGKSLIEKNNRYLVENGLALRAGEEPTFMYQLGQGATSLAGALGLTVVTKSPTAAALAFGTIQQSEVYQEAREAGLDINDSVFYANIAGVAEGVLEKIGLDVLLKSPGKRILSKMAIGAGSEAMQEASQTGAELAIKQFGDIDEFTSEEVIQALASSAIIGGVLGGGANLATGTLQNEVAKSNNRALEAELAVAEDARMDEPGLRVSRRMKEDEKIAMDIITAFMDGIDVSEVFETEGQKQAFIERASKQLLDAQLADVGIERAGTIRTLEALESDILGQITELGKEGEAAFKKFAEESKLPEDADIDAAFQETGASRKIERRESKLSNELEKIQRELEAADTLEGSEFRDTFKNVRAEVKNRVLDTLRRSTVIKGLRKGFKEGQKFNKDQTKAVQSEFVKIIDNLPDSVGDKFKTRMLKRVKNITTLNQLNRNVQKLIDDTLAHLSKKALDSVQKDVSNILKNAKSREGKQMSADTQDMVNEMVGYNRKNAVHNIKRLGGQSLLGSSDEMRLRYLELLMNPNVGRHPWQLFRNDLELFVLEGRTTWQKQQDDRDGEYAKQIDSIVGERKPIDETKNKGMTVWQKVTSPINYAVKSYQTIVDSAALQDTWFGGMFKADMVFRRALHDFNQMIKDRTAESVSSDYISKVISSKKVVLTIETGNGSVEEFTMGEAIHRYMELQNPETRTILQFTGNKDFSPDQVHAYTNKNIEDIEQVIGVDGVKFADVMFGIYQESYDRLNEVYRKVHGVSLPKVEFYVPRARNEVEEDFAEVMLSGPQGVLEFLEPSPLKQRKKAMGRLISKDVLDVAINYSNNTEWYMAYQDFYSGTKKLLSSDAVRREIKDRIGVDNFANFESHVELMRKSSISWNKGHSYFVNFVRKHFTTSILAANPQIGLKQLSSMFASMGEIGVSNWMIGATEFLANAPKAWREMSQHDSFFLRGNRSFDKELQLALQGKGSKAITGQLTLLDYMLKPVQWGDKFAGGVSAYAHYSHLKRKGMSPDKAMDKAMNVLERSQQSVLPSQLSVAQKSGEPWHRLLMMFTSSPIALVNMQMQAIADAKNGKTTWAFAMRKFAVYQAVIPGAFAWVASAFDDEPDKVLSNALGGPAVSIPFFGNSIEWVSAGMVAAALDSDTTAFRDTALATDTIAKKIHDNFSVIEKLLEEEPVTYEEYLSAISDGIEFLSGLPANNIVDIMDGFDKILDGDGADGLFKVLGYSDYTIDQREDDTVKVRF